MRSPDPTEVALAHHAAGSSASTGAREQQWQAAWIRHQMAADRLLKEQRAAEAVAEHRKGLTTAKALLLIADDPKGFVFAPASMILSALGWTRARRLAKADEEGGDLVLTTVDELLCVADDPSRNPVLRVSCVRNAWRGLADGIESGLVDETSSLRTACARIAATCRRLRPVLAWLSNQDAHGEGASLSALH